MNSQPPTAATSGPAPAPLLHDLFARQAARTPDAPAVVDAGGDPLGYAALDRRANRLARYLRGLGVGPESLVGVHLHRGPDLVVALLAVWKAGGAYVPLDPGHPRDRLAWVLADTRAGVVLTTEALAGPVRAAGARAVCLDTAHADIEAGPDTAPDAGTVPGNAAYVIYTSGSTGRPKGVVVDHAGIANRVAWAVRRHGLSAADRVLQKTSLGFDAAGWEIFAPLVSGGTVALAPVGAERDPAALVRAVAAAQATVLQVVPSVLRLLVEEPGWADCAALRLVFSAGEPLHAELAQRLAERVKVELWNTYGPTECSIDVTAEQVDPGQESGPVPIGRPIDNTRVLVLDDAGDPVPIGVAGELYAGGVGLGRGYLGRPDLTASRFVPDPYGPPGARLYRTGDLVRWRAEGTLEYLGRLDHQVKVNGVRIEPGEVEAALVAHPDVRGAVVTAVADPEGAYRLVGYVVGRGELDPQRLRGYLRDRLPDPLVPSVLVPLEEFPLTPNGKVDRAALPAPELGGSTGRPAYVAPRTPAERIVADVWADLLAVERVGVHDDFFQLGGHSLILLRLAGRLRAATGGESKLQLRELVGATTVQAQARLLAAADRPVPPPLRAVERPIESAAALPLSFGQHRLWFLDRMHPGSQEWVAPLFVPLPADVPADVVQRALDLLAGRHEILRTRYVADGGEPRQVVDAPGPVELQVVDCAPADLAEVCGRQFARGFDLAAGPVWRGLLAWLPDRATLLLTLHHIACDGWSAAILEREVREICTALAAGRVPALPDLPVQYADYAAWQRGWLTEDVLDRDLAYWRETLAGLTPLSLPTDHARPAERDPGGAVLTFTVPARLADAVEELGRRHGATPFMTLLTAYATLLARHSGQWDVPVGTPVAGRNQPELAGTVGFFLNSLVLRCGLRADDSFRDALDRVRGTSVAAFGHQDLPFERLVDVLAPVRDLSRTPLYQAAFDLHDERLTRGGADAADLATFQQAWQVAHTDLTLYLRRLPDGSMAGGLEYATALFAEPTVRRMAGHFVRLLEAFTADPELALADAPLLSAAERDQLVAGWNASAAPVPDRCVYEQFEARAAADPGAIAVVAGDVRVTFGELEARANQFARRLAGLGVGPELTVGVLLDRGPELVAALLGVWKAGAAFVPLDPSFPAGRVADMLAAASAVAVVTQSGLVDRFDGFAGGRVLVDDAALAGLSTSRVWVPADADRTAYVIFTSGSTGRPKGVQVPHRGLANHVAWAARELAGRGSSGAPLFSSVAFDLVVPNVWAPLVAGQPVQLLPQDLDLGELGAVLAAAGPFSFVKLTPGHLEVLAAQLSPGQARALAPVVVVAGEAFTAELAARWRALAPGVALVNEYGPTEASVGTCIFPVPAGPESGVLPIGRPLPNMAMYVLDGELNLLPAGVAGELYVGGAGVARGYVGEPGLTAGRFVPDPFGPAGARLYRTGDRARHRGDGNVEFLGRLDDQVKIRGYRIEPGEIRAVLLEHASVAAAVVVAHTSSGGDTRLVAYVVPAQEAVDGAALAAHCATRLPEYMVPALYLPVEDIPLNANGKVDRAALPDPAGAAATGAEEPTAPRTVTEERVAAIWSELLDGAVDVHLNFFQAGGNSLLAIRLTARLQDEFAVDLPVRAIFEGPTVAQIAAAVEDRIRAEIAQLSDAELRADPMLLKEREA